MYLLTGAGRRCEGIVLLKMFRRGEGTGSRTVGGFVRSIDVVLQRHSVCVINL